MLTQHVGLVLFRSSPKVILEKAAEKNLQF